MSMRLCKSDQSMNLFFCEPSFCVSYVIVLSILVHRYECCRQTPKYRDELGTNQIKAKIITWKHHSVAVKEQLAPICRHEFGPKGYGLWWPGNTRLCILGSNLFLPYHGHGSRGIPFASICGAYFVLIQGHFWIRGKHWQTTWHFGMHKTWLGCREYNGIPRWNIVDCQSSAQFILETSATFCQDEKPTRWLSSAAKNNFPFVVYNNQCRSGDQLLPHAMWNCGTCTFSQLSIALAMKDFPVPRFDSLKSLWEYSKIPHCLQSQRNKDSTVVSWISWVLDLSVEDKKRFPKQVKRRMYSRNYRWEIWVEIPEIGTK